MLTERLELAGSCGFEVTRYEGVQQPDVCLVYTEHSPDPWYSDHETSIDVTKDDALKIIAFLSAAWGLAAC